MGTKVIKKNNSKSFFTILLIGVLCAAGIFAYRSLSESKASNMPSMQIPADIIPKPAEFTGEEGSFQLKPDTGIYVSGINEDQTEKISRIGKYLADKLRPSTGFDFIVAEDTQPGKGNIYLTTDGGDESLGEEGYQLEVTTENVILKAFTPEGLFRGIQTIRQLLPSEIEKASAAEGVDWKIPCAAIRDYPVYEWRGMMLDAARHFIPVEDVEHTIDLIAEYKINRLHLHLSDDQGWRIEIKSWPELALIGGSTEVGGGEGGFYTQDEYTEIVNYAKERYITIVPEIDMPGHTNAALASYGELNPDGVKKSLYTGTDVGFSSLMCRSEITYRFLNDVIGELAAITPGEYIHIGGDEASQTPEEDYSYFIGRVKKIAAGYGKKIIGWGPYDTAEGVSSEDILQYWNGDTADAEAKNMKVIMSPADRAYLDMKYYPDSPLGLQWAGYTTTEKAYRWDPTDYMDKSHILGIEGPLWSETVESMDDIEYLAFPRLPGLAEIGWTPKKNRDWKEYRQRLQAHGIRMEYLGIDFFRDPVVDWSSKGR